MRSTRSSTTTQELVTGEVRLELRPAAAIVNGRRSENALYAETLASYGAGETFPHQAAEGFIQIASLETELAAARARKLAEAKRDARRGPQRVRSRCCVASHSAAMQQTDLTPR